MGIQLTGLQSYRPLYRHAKSLNRYEYLVLYLCTYMEDGHGDVSG